jgi:hypothetical protein
VENHKDAATVFTYGKEWNPPDCVSHSWQHVTVSGTLRSAAKGPESMKVEKEM